MAALEMNDTLNTLAQDPDDPQFQLPFDTLLGQDTHQNPSWEPDGHFASEYFPYTSGSSDPSDLLQADVSMACEASPNTDFDYAHREASSVGPLINETSGLLTPAGQQNQTPNQIANLSNSPGQVQLRSASRKSKNGKRRIAGVKARAQECHNLVEKQYRNRLKSRFERLLSVLPAASTLSLADSHSSANLGKVLSRGQVLDLATDRILELEKKIERMSSSRSSGHLDT